MAVPFLRQRQGLISEQATWPFVSGGPVVVLDIGVVLGFGKMRGHAGHPFGQPARVARRAPGIGQPVPQADRGSDGGQIEAPWTEEGAPVVPPAIIAVGPTVLVDRGEVVRCFLAVRRVLACSVAPLR